MTTTYLSTHFPTFHPNPSAPTKDEFTRLAQHMHWTPNSKKYQREWAAFTGNEFHHHFGTQSKLENWQALCKELNLDGPIASMTQCRKALAKVHVNLVDLIDSRRAGTPVHKFQNVRALRRYTRESGKVFPKEAAKREGGLRGLLRGIW
ncbi:hypothetical protein BO94DRAFT_563167 [Aspergillus sclerotioniger CBS 115572]|uniref:Uncharacterized protein n=1 Tax=Aspergillus sclerotioniger CBS 115572 TaxID=1450535 RepID=A0A317X7N8_9EURO|nr:hypothetical protein BO94DRAFT_563167 [Aspergillus sclerotioniger CBS 115572]PWY94549.1 hypothetical protein BO94DRAFT_563167 [Aspergillus sclerotioniger CBS 115572]